MEQRSDEAYRDIGKPLNASKIQTIILWSISALFILALGMKLFFNISRIDFIADPPSMFPDGRSTTTVRAVPYNVLGLRAPFKSIRVFYTIEAGNEKVEIISRTHDTITLQAKHETGDVIIRARLSGDMIPYEIVVPILPQFALHTAEARGSEGDRSRLWPRL
jgi:hypothetical protein